MLQLTVPMFIYNKPVSPHFIIVTLLGQKKELQKNVQGTSFFFPSLAT
jgi:hypothetical protein